MQQKQRSEIKRIYIFSKQKNDDIVLNVNLMEG